MRSSASPTVVDAGDFVQFSAVVSHDVTSTAPAFGVNITDLLNDAFSLRSGITPVQVWRKEWRMCAPVLTSVPGLRQCSTAHDSVRKCAWR